MLIWFFAGNCLLAALYAAVKAARREGWGAAVFFLFLPGLGFLIYFLPQMLQRLLGEARYDRDSLVQRFQIDRLAEHPNVREELDVVPVEDAMAVSENREKRALLLKQLKKDLWENYRILLAAEQDEDSESAHYAAAAKMEVYRLQQRQWLECWEDYVQNPEAPERYHAACGALESMLDSGVLSPREQIAYRKRFCKLVEDRIAREESVVSQREYEEYLACLAELGRYGDAETLWRKRADRLQSEAAYLKLLEMFYQMGDRRKFEACLEDLRRNRQIRLSARGLEQMRYWTDRLSGEAAAL